MVFAKTAYVTFLFLAKRCSSKVLNGGCSVCRCCPGNSGLYLRSCHSRQSLQRASGRDRPAHSRIRPISCKLDKTLTYKFTFQNIMEIEMPERVTWDENVKSVWLSGGVRGYGRYLRWQLLMLCSWINHWPKCGLWTTWCTTLIPHKWRKPWAWVKNQFP